MEIGIAYQKKGKWREDIFFFLILVWLVYIMLTGIKGLQLVRIEPS